MVDTMDVFYEFSSWREYNLCYDAVDKICRKKGQALHANGSKPIYLSTAFAEIGVLQISFRTTKYRRACYLMLQPIRLLYLGSHFRLSRMEHYPEICRRLNTFLSTVNQLTREALLPPIELWHVTRIDYAFDIETPFVAEYLRCFKAGEIPTGFSKRKDYDTSVYLTAKHGNINIYDKLVQARELYGLTDKDMIAELHHVPQGLLRIEFQCHNPYVLYMKKRYGIPDTTVQCLFDAELAQRELRGRVQSLIGKEDFFPYAFCADEICQCYELKSVHACCSLLRALMDTKELSLAVLRQIYGKEGKKNKLSQILYKIRKAGINPIPAEVAYKESSAFYLQNPYSIIVCE